MTPLSPSASVRGALKTALTNDPTVVILGETIGRGGGLWGGTAGLLDAFGPDRVRDVPVSDRAMVALALGLALGGQKPVVELSSTHRLAAVMEPLMEAADIAARSGFDATLVLRVPYGQQAGPIIDRPIGSLVSAGPRIVCARSAAAAEFLLTQALNTRGPTILLEPRTLGTDCTSAPTAVACDTVREGSHMTLVTWGEGVATALQAAEQLASEGLNAQVVDLVRLLPLDTEALAAALRQTGRLIVVHPQDFLLANRVVQAVVEGAFLYMEAPPARAVNLHQTLAAARLAATW